MNFKKAEDFWSKRVNQTDELSAVLSYNAPDYVNELYSEWELKLVDKALNNNKKKMEILDVACGVGRVSIPIAKKGHNVTGIDISQEMLNRCQSNAKKNNVDIKLIKSSATEISNLGKYEVVLCLGLLEHLTPDVRKIVLTEISKISNKALFIVNNDRSLFLRRKKRYEMKEQSENGYFCSLMSFDEIKSILKTLGFRVKIIGSNAFHSIGKLFKSKHILNFCTRMDLILRNKWILSKYFADQYMVMVMK